MNLEVLEETARLLEASRVPVIGINVSVDGPPKLHNSLRGVPEGYEQAIAALKLLRRFHRIKSSAAMTLFPANHHRIEETVLALQERLPGFNLCDLHLNFPHASPHYYGNEKIDYEDRIDLEVVRPYLQKRLNLLSPLELVERIYQRKLEDFIRTSTTPVDCAALTSNIYISEKGDVYPCTIWDRKIGSLRDAGFDLRNIISTNEYRATRSLIRQKKCPNCWTPCEAFPSIITDLKSCATSIF